MKSVTKCIFFTFFLIIFLYSCKDDDLETPENPKKFDNTVNVEVVLPEGSGIDLSGAVLFSLGSSSELNNNQTTELPYNTGSTELAYLLDDNNNVLMAGFINDERNEISIETTTEVMLYYIFDYYLLSAPNARKVFLDNVQSMSDFSGLVSVMKNLFIEDPLMYSRGTYLSYYNFENLEVLARKSRKSLKRLLIEEEVTKSGITVSKIDSVHIELQNSFPRRTKVFAYKKLFYDRNGNLTEITNYTNNPIVTFDFEPGKKMDIETLEVGSKLSQVNAQMSSVDNLSISDPIHLPVNKSSEFLAGYEIIVIGSGELNSIGRNLSEQEKKAYEDLNLKTYALDYFLPTLLDIGGNKDLLPPVGSDKETALFEAVLPVLEANSDIYDAVKENDFKSASENLLPELYGDIRLSNELRTLLTNVYNVLSDNGTMPNTFVQSQELIELGYDRTRKVMDAMYKNMNFSAKGNIEMLRTSAKSLERWTINSIDAEVAMVPTAADVCLGDALALRVSLVTFTDPDVEELEFHWKTSNKFRGRIQDINDDPQNFGASIITKTNQVSYISAALESELGGGENIETVSVTIYTKNKETGELSKIGQDAMKIDNKKGCVSFYAPFTKEVKITSRESLLCNGTEYSLGHPTFIAEFTAVEGAVSYTGKVKRKDGTFGNEFPLSTIDTSGGDHLVYRLGVGSIYIFSTCTEADALEEQQRRLDYLDEVGHQGIEITPVF